MYVAYHDKEDLIAVPGQDSVPTLMWDNTRTALRLEEFLNLLRIGAIVMGIGVILGVMARVTRLGPSGGGTSEGAPSQARVDPAESLHDPPNQAPNARAVLDPSGPTRRSPYGQGPTEPLTDGTFPPRCTALRPTG